MASLQYNMHGGAYGAWPTGMDMSQTVSPHEAFLDCRSDLQTHQMLSQSLQVTPASDVPSTPLLADVAQSEHSPLVDSMADSGVFPDLDFMHADVAYSLPPGVAPPLQPAAALVPAGAQNTTAAAAQTPLTPPDELLQANDGSGMPAHSSSGSAHVVALTTADLRRAQMSPTGHSSTGKARRRKDPLPPIEVDTSDKIAVKRARNTLAARESRRRKVDHIESLEQRNAQLIAEVAHWKRIALEHGYQDPTP